MATHTHLQTVMQPSFQQHSIMICKEYKIPIHIYYFGFFQQPEITLQNFYFLTPLPNVRRKFCQIITTKDGVKNSEPRGFLQFLPTSAQTEPPPGIPNYPFKSRYSGKCFYHNQQGLACNFIQHV